MIKSPEQILQEFANEHSYETWAELMYDCHDKCINDYTKEVMEIYALSVMNEISECLDKKIEMSEMSEMTKNI
jgi:hypothetical protein